MKYSYQIFVIGSGGTGSDFLRTISKYFSHYEKLPIHDMYIMDGDIVEKKNLSRQCFINDDIGRNKAVAMAEALNEAFSLKWKAIPNYLMDTSDILPLIESFCSSNNTISIPLLIGCVDNHACRKVLETLFSILGSCIYFDSANEFSSGQIVYASKLNNKVVSMPRSYYFPTLFDGDMRKVTEISCEELNNSSPQHLVTNELASNFLASGLTMLIENAVILNGILFFDMQNMSSHFIAYKDYHPLI